MTIESLKAYLVIVMMALALSACTVHLISGYNSQLMDDMENLQKQLNVMLIDVKSNIGKPQASYSHYQSTYTNAYAQLDTTISQLKAIPNSSVTLQQVTVLKEAVQSLETLHKKGFKSVQQVTILQNTINTDFTAIYTLQYAKQDLLKSS